MQKMGNKQRSFLNLVNTNNKDYQDAKKITLFFLSNRVTFLMDTILKNKEPATGDQSLFRLQKKFGKIYL